MKDQESKAAGKQANMKADGYTKLWVIRLFKNEETGDTISVKKCIYLSEVISFEEGSSINFNWDGPTIYVLCQSEAFYCSGNIKDFEKKMDEYIEALRKDAN